MRKKGKQIVSVLTSLLLCFNNMYVSAVAEEETIPEASEEPTIEVIGETSVEENLEVTDETVQTQQKEDDSEPETTSEEETEDISLTDVDIIEYSAETEKPLIESFDEQIEEQEELLEEQNENDELSEIESALEETEQKKKCLAGKAGNYKNNKGNAKLKLI